MFRCIDAKNFVELAAHFHEKILYDRPGYTTFNGKSAVMDFYKNIRAVKSGVHTVEKILVDNDDVVCRGDFNCLTVNNVNLKIKYADFYQLESGVILKRTTYFYSPVI